MKQFSLTAVLAACLAASFCFVTVTSVQILQPVEAQSDLQQEIEQSTHAPSFPEVFLRDVVVSNTDRDLKNTDQFFNSEPGIAINPTDPRNIVISAFSGAWDALENGQQFRNAPVWYTRDGGRFWTKEFTIPAPPGVPKGAVIESPCDETFDYGQNGTLYGTFLLNGNGEEGANCSSLVAVDSSEAEFFGEVYSGATSDPASALAWRWLVVDGKTQPTNRFPPDQPWIVVNKDPQRLGRENVYVAYQSTTMQVAVAKAKAPPDFTLDRSPGPVTSFGFNPGLRIAADRHSGAVYSLYQTAGSFECSSGLAISYVLNRSLDGGQSWELNGSVSGIQAAQACSNQNQTTYLFGEPEPGALTGGVNALKGGVDALAVDSATGDVYVAYGNFDEAAGRDRISIVRLTDGGNGRVKPGPSHFVSGPEHQSALPSIAVAEDENGTVGVLYDTADGLDEETLRPFFSVHFAISEDHGVSFHTVVLQKFLFPENAPSGVLGPRPLGDYQQLKSLGKTFYGVFSGDGQPFGRPFHKIDPIFVKTSVR
jgi:hypothetical protein